jgi:hypothetical protein
MECSCAVLSSVACPAKHYLISGMIFEKIKKKVIEHKMGVLIFSTTFG